MVVPYEQSLVNKPLLRVQVLKNFSLVPEANSIKYILNSTEFEVDSLSGDIIMNEDILNKGVPRNMSLLVTAREKDTANIQTSMIINIILKNITGASKCQMSTQEIRQFCFWNKAEYQIYENGPETILGLLGPAYMAFTCPNILTSYELLNGSDYASVDKHTNGNTWNLKSKTGLDRDTLLGPGQGPGPELNVLVSCNIELGSFKEQVTKVIKIIINDQDDNLPAVQQESTHERDIFIMDHKLKQDEQLDVSDLLLIDPDTAPVNNYEVEIIGDPHNLLTVDYTKFDYDTTDTTVPQTALYMRVHAKKNAFLPVSPYNVTLRVTDTSLVPWITKNQVDITLRLHGSNITSPPAPMIQRASSLTLATSNIPQSDMYPQNITMFKGSSQFFRIAEPSGGLSAVQGLSFKLENDWNGTFNITPVGGIVYVADVNSLINAPSNLTLIVHVNNESQTVAIKKIKIKFTEITEGPCDMYSHNVSFYHTLFCSEVGTKKECVSRCGFSTGYASPSTPELHDKVHVGCEWRTPKSLPGNIINYRTCTPRTETCPDRICDPLESLHEYLCPQDCSSDPFFDAQYHLRGNDSKILQGILVCICTPRCVCLPPDDKGPPRNRSNTTTSKPSALLSIDPAASTDPNVSADRAIDTSRCGMDCLLALVAGSFILLVSVISGFVYWRYKLVGKDRHDRKYGATATSSVTGLQTELERGLSTPEGQLITLDHNVPLQSSDPKTLPDPKWEYPRAKLVIEQTLGEGEFGRVLRAKAVDIATIPGYTTVAVKTLKEGASAAELADLLSEYHLLKEVCHPNVIRLLGACTDPSGPVYVIIEFAEHGSLRSYLRRSRHIESDGKIPNSLITFTSSLSNDTETIPAVTERVVSPITPRDILSFAWQITKGMAYLSEIKLVHRDLAARNILVATGKICKISDFGLTRDVYEDDAYLKRSKGRVPVKWMALESLSDHVYTSKSDVWSFGVLLWELVTLGASPYPGVAVQNLFHLLKAGYRMEKPENCSSHLYRIMRNCWSEEPGERPSFRELVLKLERMLEDGIEYLDLNPRSVHNRGYFSTLPSPNDILDVRDDDDVRYGNINIPLEIIESHEVSSPQTLVSPMEKITEEEEESIVDKNVEDKEDENEDEEEDNHNDITPEDELRLLDNTSKDVSLDEIYSNKTQYQNEINKCDEGNPYLSPIKQSLPQDRATYPYVTMSKDKLFSPEEFDEENITCDITSLNLQNECTNLSNACESTHL